MIGSSEAFNISEIERFLLLGEPLMTVLFLQNGTDHRWFRHQLDTGGNWVLLQEVKEWLRILPEE